MQNFEILTANPFESFDHITFKMVSNFTYFVSFETFTLSLCLESGSNTIWIIAIKLTVSPLFMFYIFF